jgi:hypothetical protein
LLLKLPVVVDMVKDGMNPIYTKAKKRGIEAKKLSDLTDWKRVKSMSEEEIEENAHSDPENPPLSPDWLKTAPKVRRNRHRDRS